MQKFAGALVLILTFGCAQGAGAESSMPQDFTFKRLKVGGGLPGKRITVQIDPAEQARVLAALPKVDPDGVDVPVADPATPAGPMAPVVPAGASYDWFWNTVPVARDQVDGRFPLAMATLSQGPGGVQVAAPRMQHMQEMADQYGTQILAATIDTEVSPALVLAVIGVESAGKPRAVSTAGAVGLM